MPLRDWDWEDRGPALADEAAELHAKQQLKQIPLGSSVSINDLTVDELDARSTRAHASGRPTRIPKISHLTNLLWKNKSQIYYDVKDPSYLLNAQPNFLHI